MLRGRQGNLIESATAGGWSRRARGVRSEVVPIVSIQPDSRPSRYVGKVAKVDDQAIATPALFVGFVDLKNNVGFGGDVQTIDENR